MEKMGMVCKDLYIFTGGGDSLESTHHYRKLS